MRIGIIGGSFNPVHSGHVHIAEEAVRLERLDKVMFVVAARPPHKEASDLAPYAERRKMAALAIEGEPDFEISDVEEKRPGASYTVETLVEIGKMYPGAELFFIIGADTLPELKTWRTPADVLAKAQLVVFARPGYTHEAAAAALPFASLETLEKIAAHTHVSEPMDVSASEIRRRVRAGVPIAGMVPPAVEKYIHEQRLFI
jgi:nicotinate-nucleotide adenylyltransferase